jgi:hypothetical protein
MECLFRADFSTVRVHESKRAEELRARAFCTGENIYFAPGKFAPGSSPDRGLLAHELTHVLQQRAGRVRAPGGAGPWVVMDPRRLEDEARENGERAVREG